MRSRRLLATIVLVICLGLVTSALGQAPVPAGAPPDFDSFVAQVMKTFEVPGVGRGHRQGRQGRRGQGLRRAQARRADAGRRADPSSASPRTRRSSRPPRSACWSRRASCGGTRRSCSYLPWFQMWDPYVTRELTVRDLLVHRSGLGLGAGDLLWWPASTYDRKEIARRLRFIQAGDELPKRVRVRQRPLSDRRRSHRDGEWPVVGGLRRGADPEEGRHDGQHRAPFGRRGRRQRRGSARRGRGHRAADQAVRQRQHQPGRRHQFQRRGHGEVGHGAAERGHAADGSRLFSARTARELTTIVTPLSVPASLRRNSRRCA